MKILVIEDQAMFRGIIVKLCRDAFSDAHVEHASAGVVGLALCVDLQPDVVLLDLELPDVYGLEIIDQILDRAPGAKIIVLSSHTEDYALYRCLKSSIDGFVDKNNEPAESIVEAIKSVVAGRSFFTAAVGRFRSLLREDSSAFTKLLSEREQDLLRLFGLGLSNDEIGTRVSLSPNTVLNHRRNIMSKLGIHSTPELMRYASEKGFSRLGAAR